MTRAGCVLRATLTPVLAVVLALCVHATTAAAQDLARLFPEEAEVTAPGPGLVRLPLPAAVLQASAPDLSDVRLFDRTGNEVPYLVDPGLPAGTVREERLAADARVLDVSREEVPRDGAPSYTRETYRVALPDAAPAEGAAPHAWTLVFDSARRRFVRDVEVRGVAADGSRTVLVPRASLVRLGQRLVDDLEVALPPFDGDELVVTITGEEGAFLEPVLRFASARTIAPADALATPLAVRAQRREDGWTILEVDRPPGLVPARLALATGTPVLDRRVTVRDVAADGTTTPLGEGRVVRALGAGGTPLAERLAIDLAPARGQRLRIAIEDGDSPPLADLAVTVLVSQPALLFALPPATPGERAGVLRFGGGRAFPPRYDVAALVADARVAVADPGRLPSATLGPIRPNPAFDAGPLLEPVMRAGGAVDVDAWRWHRPIEVPSSPEGLVRVRLTAEDLAHASASRADLRVVDRDGRQWPFLVGPAVARDDVALGVERPRSVDGESRFRLVLPAAPLTVDRLVVEPARPVLDRPYRVVTTDDAGEERVLAQGRLVQDLRRPRPVAITFAATRVDDLELRFADGDDAPVELARVATSLPAPDLLLAAPAGSYVLLAGNDDADAPRYELARARDVVRELKSVPASGPPGAQNPRWTGTPGGAGARRERLARIFVWGAIVLAVVVLGALTLRVARRTPPAS